MDKDKLDRLIALLDETSFYPYYEAGIEANVAALQAGLTNLVHGMKLILEAAQEPSQ